MPITEPITVMIGQARVSMPIAGIGWCGGGEPHLNHMGQNGGGMFPDEKLGDCNPNEERIPGR